jgi:valyl-tRNA synthetase
MEAVRGGRIRFVPDDREPVFFQWMENIRDWCISRQLWWGHRIPAWHCGNCKQITVTRETPAICPHCGSTALEQDPDVLDTWFSSGLWPFSTLGWPENTEDFRVFYPTSLLITGFDILFFWVSRMIMLGLEMTGEVPFREVHMHGLVRDAERQKMSKTRGNVVDPLEIIDRFGTDAFRVALLISAATGADIALKIDRIEAGRAFANKLWNASRLLFMNMDRSGISDWKPRAGGTVPFRATEDIWIASRLRHAIETINRALKVHRYHEAAQTVWEFVWNEFCDWYLEVKKRRFREGSGVDEHWEAALTVYETMLRMAHPVMPFITEELWQRLGLSQSGPKSISLAAYPTEFQTESNPEAVRRFGVLQQIVTAARELRADNKLDPKATLDATLHLHAFVFDDADLAAVSSLAQLNLKQERGSVQAGSGALRSTPEFDLQIHAAAQMTQSGPEARARIEKENAALRKTVDNYTRQLADETFLSKAPAKVIEGMRAKLADYQAQIEKNKKLLEGLQ